MVEVPEIISMKLTSQMCALSGALSVRRRRIRAWKGSALSVLNVIDRFVSPTGALAIEQSSQASRELTLHMQATRGRDRTSAENFGMRHRPEQGRYHDP